MTRLSDDVKNNFEQDKKTGHQPVLRSSSLYQNVYKYAFSRYFRSGFELKSWKENSVSIKFYLNVSSTLNQPCSSKSSNKLRTTQIGTARTAQHMQKGIKKVRYCVFEKTVLEFW